MQLGLRSWASVHPERIAVAVGGQELSYQELELQANRLARVFDSYGLARGEHVAALLPNDPFLIVVAWAAYRRGLYFTPVSTALSTPDAAYILGNCQARLVIAQGPAKASLTELPGLVGGAVQWLSYGGTVPGYTCVEPAMQAQSGGPSDSECAGALMLYTSGTTGFPKGVWRPLPAADYAGPPAFAADLISIFQLDAESRYLLTGPLYHAASLRAVLAVTSSGGSAICLQKFDAETALGTIMGQRVTHSQWVPTMLQRLLRLPDQVRKGYHAPRHRLAFHAAAPCPVPVKQAMIDWWGPIMMEYYAGSESVGMTVINSQEWLAHPGSVGKARRGVPHILDDGWNELPAGQAGRIYFSGLTAFQYFGDPAKTAGRTSPQGYQTLGDIGHVDAEGFMYLTDRMDDMIISGGVNVYPQEVEAAIIELPEVADVGVVGVSDDEFGERPVAFIAGIQGADPALLESLVRTHCEKRLGTIKRPVRYVVMQELPRSAAGKMLRRELRTLVDSSTNPQRQA
jgi:long-chain acyl-CoA synthetase